MGNAQKAGKRWETQVTNDLYRATERNVDVTPAGYSGNHASPAADVKITAPVYEDGLATDIVKAYQLELKRHSRPRDGTRTDRSATVLKNEENGLTQLLRCLNDYTAVGLGVKFTRCEMALSMVSDASTEMELAEKIVDGFPQGLDPRVTASGNIRLTKPDNTDDHPSSNAGRPDHVVIADTLGLEIEE